MHFYFIFWSAIILWWLASSLALIFEMNTFDDDDWKSVGESKFVWITLLAIPFPFGLIIYYMCVREKLVELKKARKKMERMEEMKEVLTHSEPKKRTYTRKSNTSSKDSKPENLN